MPRSRLAMAALFLLAGGVLVLEVTLTRVFSVMSWHHFAYLIISLALLGFGAASSFLTVSRRFAGEDLDPARLARYALGFSIATLLGFITATKIRFYPMDAYTFGDYSNLYSLWLLYLVIGAPFFFAGVCIAYLISKARDAIHRLYFADLLGAGLGALVAIAGINRLGVEATIYAVAASAALVAVLYAYATPAAGAALRRGALAVLALAVAMSALASKRELFPLYFPPDKIFRLAQAPHDVRWHVVARVDILDPKPGIWSFGGVLSPRYYEEVGDEQVLVRGVYQDGGAATGIIHVEDGDVRRIRAFDYYLQAAPYVVQPGPRRTLVIGVGGGSDVVLALYHGSAKVVGVEINPKVVDALRNTYDDFAGGLFNSDRVELVTSEGRHFLTATRDSFDVIQLSGVDTYSALSSGAYALAENFLYTVEAMDDYWEHLTQDGVLSFSRWLFEPPRESLRLVAVQVAALMRRGIAAPEKHFVVVRGQDLAGNVWAETLLRKRPFTREEAQAYAAWAQRLGFEILYDPFTTRANPFDRMIRGTPAARQAMIADYPYAIDPVTDNKPFFFDFYRWRNLWSPAASKGEGGYYITRFPLALAVLVVSLVQILVLAAVFILGPLARRGSTLRDVPHKGTVMVYFAALGLAFISVEIVLLQKYAVFVGGPVYSMAATLASMLVFSGAGSLLAQRFRGGAAHTLTAVLAAVVMLIVGQMFFVNHGIPRLMGLSHASRCAVAVLAVAPLALFMGMPFPTGLRVTQALGTKLVPWAWGVNAVTTTLGSMTCVLASMQWGFNASLIAAAGVYVIGLLAIRPVAARTPVE